MAAADLILEALKGASHLLLKADASKWVCGAARGLPISGDDDWDGGKEAAAILDASTDSDGNIDAAKASKGFLAYDSANPNLRGSYKLPFASVTKGRTGGRMSAVTGGLRAAASRLPQADLPDEVQAKARRVLDAYEARMKPEKRFTGLDIKDLRDVAALACLMDQLGYQVGCAWQEAQREGDSSSVPGMLLDALRQVGASLQAMSGEEAGELLSALTAGMSPAGSDDEADRVAEKAGQALVKKYGWPALSTKEGRVLSGGNAAELRKHCMAIKAAHDGIMALVTSASPAA